MDQPRTIPVASRQLGQVRGNYFRAVIYQTPENEIGAEVTIDAGATKSQLNGDQMDARIILQSNTVAGKEPDFYVTHKKVLA